MAKKNKNTPKIILIVLTSTFLLLIVVALIAGRSNENNQTSSSQPTVNLDQKSPFKIEEIVNRSLYRDNSGEITKTYIYCGLGQQNNCTMTLRLKANEEINYEKLSQESLIQTITQRNQADLIAIAPGFITITTVATITETDEQGQETKRNVSTKHLSASAVLKEYGENTRSSDVAFDTEQVYEVDFKFDNSLFEARDNIVKIEIYGLLPLGTADSGYIIENDGDNEDQTNDNNDQTRDETDEPELQPDQTSDETNQSSETDEQQSTDNNNPENTDSTF